MGWPTYVRNQYMASIAVNILSIAFGGTMGWMSSSYLELQSAATPLATGPLNKHELGWVTCSPALGALLVTVFLTSFADKYGRKRFLLCLSLPVLLSWLIISLARHPWHLCLARFLAGSAGGGSFTVIPLYITEIAENRLRSTLGTFLGLGTMLGFLLINVLSYYFSFAAVARVMCALPLLFVACFLRNPETPQFLVMHNAAKAQAALSYYRGIDSNAKPDVEVQQELNRLCEPPALEAREAAKSSRVSCAEFLQPKARKAFLIGSLMVLINQLSGLLPLQNYISSIFSQAGSGLSARVSTIIVCFIQLLGTYATTHFVENAGRKTLLICSTAGICLGELALSAYYYLTAQGYDTSSCSWVPIAALSFVVFTASGGAMSIIYVVMAEICPPRIRSMAVRIHISCIFILGMTILKTFPLASAAFGIAGTIFAFAVFSFVLTILVIIFVPETKGKTIEEIQASL
ncbi:facilitated trehalose transporter Tret1-like isoform X2 [Drosophila busckii]|uniref:facilitated trehalose transporter Tret1-like isoform X2 n=1 Tax=Drosophila busckii TaxID=30019 RepID=UPI00083F2721|nr:facilitated trehalose transporter Tret1-like isoform X2 [Drosophila busckii]